MTTLLNPPQFPPPTRPSPGPGWDSVSQEVRITAVDDDGREAAGYGRYNHTADDWALYADDFSPTKSWTVKGWQ